MVIEKNGKIMYNLGVGSRHTGGTGHLCSPYQLNLQGDKVPTVKTYKIKEYEIMIDDEDHLLLSGLKIRPDVRENHIYFKCLLKTDDKWTSKYLHRMIIGAQDGFIVDHINGNTLDNRKTNLRICTQGDNTCNSIGRNRTSKHKGVYWDKKRKRWYVEISRNKKTYYVGVFKDEIEAAKAYDKAAIKYHREYARLNFTKGY